MIRTRAAALVPVATVLTALLAVGGADAARSPGQQAPKVSGSPTISGTPVQGQILTAGRGSWTGTSLTYRYQWLRCNVSGGACGAIAGETASSHLATATDVGTTLRMTVTAHNKYGTASATSAATAVIAPLPTPTS